MAYKVVMGWAVGYVFFSYYQQGDTINYFTDGRQLAQIAYQQPGYYLQILLGLAPPPSTLVFLDQPRAFFFAKCVSVVNIFTFNNYWITSVYFSLIAFSASWVLANDLSRRFPEQRYAAAVAFLGYPSVVFWSSGVLKESLAVAAIMGIVYLVLRLQAKAYTGARLVPIGLTLLLAIWILWRLKYYYAGVLLPTLLSAIIAQAVGRRRNTLITIVSFVVIWLTLIGLASLLHPRLAIGQLLEVLVYNHDAIVRMSDASNLIHFQSLDETAGSFLKNLPLALVSGLFCPLIGEGTTVFQWLAGLENTVLLMLFVGALCGRQPNARKPAHRVWLMAIVTYVVVLGSLLAFASPNFGSLVRYRVAFLPFLVYLCLVGNQWLMGWLERKLSR